MELGIKPYFRGFEAIPCHLAAASHYLSTNALSTISGSCRHASYLNMLLHRIEIYPGIGYGNSLVVLFCGGKDMDAVFVHVVKVGINNILLYEEYILPQFQNMKQLTRSELVYS